MAIDFGPNMELCHTSRTRDHNVKIQDPYILSYLLHKNSPVGFHPPHTRAVRLYITSRTDFATYEDTEYSVAE